MLFPNKEGADAFAKIIGDSLKVGKDFIASVKELSSKGFSGSDLDIVNDSDDMLIVVLSLLKGKDKGEFDNISIGVDFLIDALKIKNNPEKEFVSKVAEAIFAVGEVRGYDQN